MKKLHSLGFFLIALGLLSPCGRAEESPAAAVPAAPPLATAPSLLKNGSMETDADADGWPDDWPRNKDATRQEESGNHFIRLKSPSPGTTVMLYLKVPMPAGAKALEMKWKQRASELKAGKQAWFDARIMMEFRTTDDAKVPGGPGAPYLRKATDGWQDRSMQFLVPEGAASLVLMPALFQVETGTLDLDDFSLSATDPAPLKAKAEAEAAKKLEELKAKLAGKQAKAAQILLENGSLIPGGDFEKGFEKKKNIAEEEGNHFLRLQSTTPGKLVSDYQLIDLPPDTKALELTWKQRITGLKKGEKPWFDARIMLEWKDAAGGKVSDKPSPPYSQRDTSGWVEKSTSFLVPDGAATLVMMPSLFQVTAGTYDLDNLVLKPTSPETILAAKEAAKRQVAARFVPDEVPNPGKWPKMIKVVGNRLQDADGKEVWLQGVNVGGLETLPQDEQPVKSLVVAIDGWKANCVRVPMKEEFWWGKSPYQNDGGEGFRKKIDKMITLAANRGAYIVIDLHRFRAPIQEHADFWKEFAAKYKDHPAVLFDLFNEPHGISWDIWRDGGFVGTKEGTDESAFLTEEEKKKNQGFQSIGMQALVNAVRTTGAKNIVIAGGLFWCNDLTGITKGYALDDKGGNGIMYSWHTYNW
ncbi:MAG: cellulase family glycosylhydrolase, partial [Luteolibacter sp.]